MWLQYLLTSKPSILQLVKLVLIILDSSLLSSWFQVLVLKFFLLTAHQ